MHARQTFYHWAILNPYSLFLKSMNKNRNKLEFVQTKPSQVLPLLIIKGKKSNAVGMELKREDQGIQ